MKFDLDSIDIAYVIGAGLFVWAASDTSAMAAKYVAGVFVLLPVLLALVRPLPTTSSDD